MSKGAKGYRQNASDWWKADVWFLPGTALKDSTLPDA